MARLKSIFFRLRSQKINGRTPPTGYFCKLQDDVERTRGINGCALMADFVAVARVLITRRTCEWVGKRTRLRREKVCDETYIVCDVRH